MAVLFLRCANRISIVNGSTLMNLLGKQQSNVLQQQSACISSKVWRDMNGIKRPPPYDYINKTFTLARSWFDIPTIDRMDENSKYIIVEGPIACGKTKFAKELAEKLDMYYMPQTTMDDVYINEYGFDLRQLDDQLPPGVQSFDEKKFVADPYNRLVAPFQNTMYHMKVRDHIDALAHLFSTGQGVIVERSPFSDFVFNEALFRCGCITKVSYNGIQESYVSGNYNLFRPHLVIYLDVPVEETLENIKKRNLNNEANSPLFKDNKFLMHMDDVYKRDFLKEINIKSELLVYDWSNGGEIELVVDDIEQIDFDKYETYEQKLLQWKMLKNNADWTEERICHTEFADEIFADCQPQLWHCPDFLIEPEDQIVRERVYEEAKGMKYAYGYNTELGDTGILTKTKLFHEIPNRPKPARFEF